MSYPIFSREQDRLSRAFSLVLALGGAQVVWFGIAGFLAGGRFALQSRQRWDELIPLESLAIPWFVTVGLGALTAVLAVALLIDRRRTRPVGYMIQCLAIVVLVFGLWSIVLAFAYPRSVDPYLMGWHWIAAPLQIVTVLALALLLAREARRERAERERAERDAAAQLAAATAPRRRWGRR